MNKHSIRKKLLACSLSAMLAVSMLPATPAFAETTNTNQKETTSTKKAFTVPKIEDISFDTNSVDVTNEKATIVATVKMNTADVNNLSLTFENDNYDSFYFNLEPSAEDPSVLSGSAIVTTTKSSGTYTADSMTLNTNDGYHLSFSKYSSLAPIPKKLRDTTITVKSSASTTPDEELPNISVTKNRSKKSGDHRTNYQ